MYVPVAIYNNNMQLITEPQAFTQVLP